MKKLTKLTLISALVAGFASGPAMALDYSKTQFELEPEVDEFGPELMLVSMRPAEDKMVVKYEDRGGKTLKMLRFAAAISTDGQPVAPELLENGGYVVPDSYGGRMISGPLSLKKWFKNSTTQEFTRTDMQYGYYLSEQGLAEGAGFLYLTATFSENGMSAGAWAVEIDYRDCLLAPDMTECRAVVSDDGSGVVSYVPFDDAGNDLSYQVQEAKMARLMAENERLLTELEIEKNKPAEVIEVIKEVPVEVEKEVTTEVVREVAVSVPVERRTTSYVAVASGDEKTLKSRVAELEAENERLRGEILEKTAVVEALQTGRTEVPETLQGCNRDDKTVYWWAIVALSIGLLGLLAWWFLPVPMRRKKHEQE